MKSFYADKRIMVTGGAGFIGSNLVDTLVGSGADVIAIDNLQSGVIDNLQQSINSISFYNLDVRDKDALQEIAYGVDIVFHLAGNALVPYSVENPIYDFESNILGTFNILQLLQKKLIERVVFSSSAAVYGIPQCASVDESHILEPVSPYGASKLAAERLGVGWARTYNLEFVVARIYNTYGPRQRKYVMYDLIKKLHDNPNRVEVLGDGTQVRDYSYVSDTIRALLLLGCKGESGEAYNIAGCHPINIASVLNKLIQLMHLENIEIVYTGQSWVGDVPVMSANIEKLRLLGFTPHVNLDDGLNKLINWVKINENLS